jgi:hypothetical protein
MRDIVGNTDVGNKTREVGILNLLEVPHFGCNLEINSCVKLLLSCIHGGTLWLDPPVSIDTALIAQITGLPKAGEDPTILFNKVGERALSEEMKEKFHTFRGKKGIGCHETSMIDGVQFAMQVLACKLLCKVL